MLSLNNATARIRCRLLSCSKSAAAFAALFCQVPHTSPEGLRLHKIAFAAMLVSSATGLAMVKEAHLIQLHSQPAAYCQRRARIAIVLILLPPAFAGPPSQRLLRLQKSTSRNTSKKQRLTKTTFRNTSEKRSKVWERFCPPAHPSKDLGRAEIQTPL